MEDVDFNAVQWNPEVASFQAGAAPSGGVLRNFPRPLLPLTSATLSSSHHTRKRTATSSLVPHSEPCACFATVLFILLLFYYYLFFMPVPLNLNVIRFFGTSHLAIAYLVIAPQAGTSASGRSAAGGADRALSTARSSAAGSLTSTTPTRRRILLLWHQSSAGCPTGPSPSQHVS